MYLSDKVESVIGAALVTILDAVVTLCEDLRSIRHKLCESNKYGLMKCPRQYVCLKSYIKFPRRK